MDRRVRPGDAPHWFMTRLQPLVSAEHHAAPARTCCTRHIDLHITRASSSRSRGSLHSRRAARRSQRDFSMARMIVRQPSPLRTTGLPRCPRCSLAECASRERRQRRLFKLHRRARAAATELESVWLAPRVVAAAVEGRQQARGTPGARSAAQCSVTGWAPFPNLKIGAVSEAVTTAPHA
jgi:hypothetical protein